MQKVSGQEIAWGADQRAVYSGTLDDRGRPHGQGRLETKAGVYFGEFRDGRMEGQGVFEYANGNRYEGKFLDNKRHGKGTLLWARGEKYTGDFLAGLHLFFNAVLWMSFFCFFFFFFFYSLLLSCLLSLVFLL
jgi:hypothetical protein